MHPLRQRTRVGAGAEAGSVGDAQVIDLKGGYLMPTAFTPNGDGINDCYGVSFWGVIEKIDFKIFNRWGERIFYSKTPGECWNGIYKGALQKSDVYVYLIEAKTSCGEVFKKGTFVLIR